MKVRIRKQLTIVLTLNEEEARWLKAAVQNPFHGKNLEEESSTDSGMRKDLWNALHKGLGDE